MSLAADHVGAVVLMLLGLAVLIALVLDELTVRGSRTRTPVTLLAPMSAAAVVLGGTLLLRL